MRHKVELLRFFDEHDHSRSNLDQIQWYKNRQVQAQWSGNCCVLWRWACVESRREDKTVARCSVVLLPVLFLVLHNLVDLRAMGKAGRGILIQGVLSIVSMLQVTSRFFKMVRLSVASMLTNVVTKWRPRAGGLVTMVDTKWVAWS